MDGVVPSLTVEDVVTPWLKYGWKVVSGGLLNLRVGSVLGERLVEPGALAAGALHGVGVHGAALYGAPLP